MSAAVASTEGIRQWVIPFNSSYPILERAHHGNRGTREVFNDLD